MEIGLTIFIILFFAGIIFIILFFAGIIFYSIYFSKKAIIKRKLKKAVTVKISQFRSGETAKITGKIELSDQPLFSPLSNRKCAYYYVEVEKKVFWGKNTRWITIIKEEVAGNFVIKDDNSYAYFKTNNIKSYIVQDRSFSSGLLKNATANLEQYLSRHGYKSKGFFGFNKTLRYKEGILEEGEEISLLGKGEWRDAYELQLPDNYGRVLVISAPLNEPVYLSNDPDTLKNKI